MAALACSIEFCCHKSGNWEQLGLLIELKLLLTVEVDGKGRYAEDWISRQQCSVGTTSLGSVLGRSILMSFWV